MENGLIKFLNEQGVKDKFDNAFEKEALIRPNRGYTLKGYYRVYRYDPFAIKDAFNWKDNDETDWGEIHIKWMVFLKKENEISKAKLKP